MMAADLSARVAPQSHVRAETGDSSAAVAGVAGGVAGGVSGQGAPGKKLGCNSCGGVTFEDPRAHREHFKTEWHRYNLKQKVAGLPSVDKSTFEELALMEPLSSDPFN